MLIEPEHEHHQPEVVDASKGYEDSDVRVSGILVFLTAMVILGAVTAVLVFGIGKILNARMAKQDGPLNKWSKTVNLHDLGGLPSTPQMAKRYEALTSQYPTPRLQNDDGNQDVVELHAREDLLLNHYSWADQSKGKVRIPIERAMDLVASRGLPVVALKVESNAASKAHPATSSASDAKATLLTGDEKPIVNLPLTSGFARTGYEQELAREISANSQGNGK